LSELSKRLKQIGLSVLLVFTLATVCAAQKPTAKAQPKPPRPEARPGRVTSAHLAGVNIPTVAACPVKLNFRGAITTDGPAEVKYTWVSFDGGSWPEGTLKVTRAGTERVSQQLQMGAPNQNVNGWLQLKVLSPNTLVSNKAKYSVRCPAKKGKKR
jgi:hypothetical protein